MSRAFDIAGATTASVVTIAALAAETLGGRSVSGFIYAMPQRCHAAAARFGAQLAQRGYRRAPLRAAQDWAPRVITGIYEYHQISDMTARRACDGQKIPGYHAGQKR